MNRLRQCSAATASWVRQYLRLFVVFFPALGGTGLPIQGFAQEVVSASADVTIELGMSVFAADEDVSVDSQLGTVVLENLGAIPEASDITAFGLAANGDRLIAFDTTTALVGGIVPGQETSFAMAAPLTRSSSMLSRTG